MIKFTSQDFTRGNTFVRLSAKDIQAIKEESNIKDRKLKRNHHKTRYEPETTVNKLPVEVLRARVLYLREQGDNLNDIVYKVKGLSVDDILDIVHQ